MSFLLFFLKNDDEYCFDLFQPELHSNYEKPHMARAPRQGHFRCYSVITGDEETRQISFSTDAQLYTQAEVLAGMGNERNP